MQPNGPVALWASAVRGLLKYTGRDCGPGKTGATSSHHSHLEEVVPTLMTLPDAQLVIGSTSLLKLLSKAWTR